MRAHYRGSAGDFLEEPVPAVVGRLTAGAARAGFYQQKHAQTEAWETQIEILRRAIEYLCRTDGLSRWHVLLEYPIPRRGKRIDAVLLGEGLVFVVEFKCGASRYDSSAVRQTEDYCLDLCDFHLESRGRRLVPVLVASCAPEERIPELSQKPGTVAPVLRANASNLGRMIELAANSLKDSRPLDPEAWEDSDYLPTPTIVEAAQHLYAGHNVREISRCHGGVANLTSTAEAVIRWVRTAQEQGTKTICFVTGVPGSGKTLAGLNIVHNKVFDTNLGVFLSGNGPLVKVLVEALARDHHSRNGGSRSDSRRRVSTFIQNVHRFIDEYYGKPARVPADRVVIFDEAQRAWDREQSFRKFKRDLSEPELMLSIMDRHPDWSVIVCLVGSGQEINSGEAGLSEWGRALAQKFPHWRIVISPMLVSTGGGSRDALFETEPQGLDVRTEPALHLSVSLRSFRAEALSEWVAAVLDSRPAEARSILEQMRDYPVELTRSLDSARRWLRERQRGLRRTGIIASSGARRLRAVGLDVKNVIEVEHWFLNPPEDVRSSYSLETVATEFDIQGLELDWTCLAWGEDLSRGKDGWRYRQFRGDHWQKVSNPVRQRYILNKYRVLLTRAREGMVIFIPEGSIEDPTRPPEVYDSVFRYLQECGLRCID